jgi:hypothetical protein
MRRCYAFANLEALQGYGTTWMRALEAAGKIDVGE